MRGSETSDIFGGCLPLHGPGTTSLILRSLSPTCPSLYNNSTHSFLISRMFILINPSPTHHSPIPYSLAPPTPRTHTRTILHFTPLYAIPLPFHARKLLNLRPYLHSPYAQIELILYHVLHISPHPDSYASTSSNE